jgi:hypothetical protein|tara:strand:+ start:108 stop:236 length:129 start_codon:yes stop_codon:yes gene_type:complete
MPVVTVKGKKKHLKYPANWSKMSPKLKAAWIKSKKTSMKKKA